MKYTIQQLKDHVEKSLLMADHNRSKLNDTVLSIEGMSGVKTRHFYNNICELNNANYLEIGTWHGSSFVSALYKNEINAICIDNWSEFNGDRNVFLSNVTNVCGEQKYKWLEMDCWDTTENDIDREIDIYLYDGFHTRECQKKAITHYMKYMAKYFILMIDDWRPDWEAVQGGTYEGLKEMDIKIHHLYERASTQCSNGAAEYWNGIGILVCEKL